MTSTKAFFNSKGPAVQFVKDQLVSSIIDSPWTIAIVPGKFAGYFVYIATDMPLEGIDEIMSEFSKELSHT